MKIPPEGGLLVIDKLSSTLKTINAREECRRVTLQILGQSLNFGTNGPEGHSSVGAGMEVC